MKRSDIRNVTLTVMMTALMCISGPMSIPIGAAPFSLTPLSVYLAAYILGMRNSTIAYLIYLLIGFVGVPVMSDYSDGPAKILGPTGGYLMALILMVLMTGFVVERFYRNILLQAVVMFVALIICYAVGITWFVGQTKMALPKVLVVCVYPFILLDCIKPGPVIITGHPVRERLHGFLQIKPVASLVRRVFKIEEKEKRAKDLSSSLFF